LANIPLTVFTDFRNYWEQRRPLVEEPFRRELSALLDGIPLKDGVSLRAALEAGKKIRGCLSCLISEALGGDLQSAMPRAVAIELVQAATLIHDDFVDRDPVRGNRPAAWVIEGPRRAVLIGDVLFATAIQMMSDLSREDGLTISRAIAQVSQGALREPLEPVALSREIAADRYGGRLYEKIIHLKTGILFGAACHLGALAAGADQQFRQKAFRFGILIGEAYQLADDLSEVRQHLQRPAITPREALALAPACLHFVSELRPYLNEILTKASTTLHGTALEGLAAAAGLMEKAIEGRLEGALAELKDVYFKNSWGELVRKTPKDILRVFNDSQERPVPSGP
jgi:hypothetical protein